MKVTHDLDLYQEKAMCTLEEIATLNIEVPDVQRSVDEERVNDIIEYQTQHFRAKNTFCFIGDLLLARSGTNRYIILDGMHRYTAMKRIFMLMPSYNVSLTIVKDNSTMSYQEIFTLINKSKPVPEHVIRTTMDLHKRSILEGFRNHFTMEFKNYISRSQNPKRPNVNMDVLLDLLSKNDKLIDKCGSGKIIFQYIKFVNANFWKEIDPKNSLRCIEKAQKNNSTPLFISNDVDSRWATSAPWFEAFGRSYLSSLASELDAKGSQSASKASVSLPKSVRVALWKKKHGGAATGICVVCKDTITISNFECGHIVSRYNGGSDALSNLVPICGLCNKSIGKMNMGEFCNKYEISIEF
jgi:hypothetical protein